MATVLAPTLEQILFPPAPRAGQRAVWQRIAHHARAAALDLVFPPHCGSCGAPLPADTNAALCRGCAELIRWVGTDRCQRCGDGVGLGAGAMPDCPSCRTHPPAFVRSACALAKYAEGPVRRLILAMKFGRKHHLARPLGELLAQRIRDTELLAPQMIVVPAPLTRSALGDRSYNQSEEIALHVAYCLKLPLETRLLQKVRSTPPQATLSHEQRRKNLKDAFACEPRVASRHNGRCVLLIDDVITTCSTISECARTLSSAGISEVRAAAVARG